MEAAAIKFARQYQWSYDKAFNYLCDSYSAKTIEKYDLNTEKVAQLELQRAMIRAFSAIPGGQAYTRQLAIDVGITEWTKLDEKRFKIEFTGVYDLLIAFISSLVRIMKRIELSVTPLEAKQIACDALQTALLACLDHRRSGGRNLPRLRGAYIDMVANLARTSGFKVPIRMVVPGTALVPTGVQRVKTTRISDEYKATVTPVVNSMTAVTTEEKTNRGLPRYTQGRKCIAYNLVINGVKHIQPCTDTDPDHLSTAHVCLICDAKHPMYNCHYVRAFMSLDKYNRDWNSIVYDSKTLPKCRLKRSGGGGGPKNGGGKNRDHNNNNGSNNSAKNAKKEQDKPSKSTKSYGCWLDMLVWIVVAIISSVLFVDFIS